MKHAAVIVAAGQGRRMGFDKLMAPLGDRPVLQWSLDAFRKADLVEHIVIVATAERFAALDIGGDKSVTRVDGGNERFHSVVRGLDALPGPPEHVAVHDGARPLILPEQIDDCLALAQRHDAVTLARRVTETVKNAGEDLLTTGSVPRESLWIMETPQAFRFATLRDAYRTVEARRLEVTDEVSVVEAVGTPTKLIENPHPNPKITVPRDLAVAEALMKTRAEG